MNSLQKQDAIFKPTLRAGSTDGIERLRVIEAIDAEPELPGDVPPKLALMLERIIESGNIDALMELMRITVRETKKCIRERVMAL